MEKTQRKAFEVEPQARGLADQPSLYIPKIRYERSKEMLLAAGPNSFKPGKTMSWPGSSPTHTLIDLGEKYQPAAFG